MLLINKRLRYSEVNASEIYRHLFRLYVRKESEIPFSEPGGPATPSLPGSPLSPVSP